MKPIASLALPLIALAACSASGDAASPADAAQVSLEPGPSLSSPRATHALVRAADRYLLAIGGCVENGCEAGPASATVDIISADGARVIGQGRLLEPRVMTSAIALPDGTVLVAGGWVGGSVTASTEIFDPETGKSVAGPAMSVPRTNPSITQLADGRILIAGGHDGQTPRGDAEIYDPAARTFTRTGSLQTARSGASATPLPDGRILLAGGGNEFGNGRQGRTSLASAEIYDPRTRQFTETGSLAQRRYKHGAVALADGSVLIIGGSDERDYGGKLDSVERYDIASGKFVPAGTLAAKRFKLAGGVMLVAPGKILIAAGDEHPELFDVASGRGTLLDASLDGQWNYMTMAPAGERSALLAGGYLEGRIEPTDRSWIVRF